MLSAIKHKIKTLQENPKSVITKFCASRVFALLPDKTALKLLYYGVFGKRLDLKDPGTFNAKLQWLKLYDQSPSHAALVDKIAVREYIKRTVGEKYTVPLYGTWEHFDDIDFDTLPSKFVLKCNHGSGDTVICRDKSSLNLEKARKILESSLKRNYYIRSRERPYKSIRPMILAEKLLEPDNGFQDLMDYKFMVFGGKVKCLFVCSNRFKSTGLNVTFFDRDWNLLPFERHYPKDPRPIPRPDHLDEMISVSETLAQGMKFCRIDLYSINGQIYVGEITLYPGGGFEEFEPEEYDRILGEWLQL